MLNIAEAVTLTGYNGQMNELLGLAAFEITVIVYSLVQIMIGVIGYKVWKIHSKTVPTELSRP